MAHPRRWIPGTARFVAMGQLPKGTGAWDRHRRRWCEHATYSKQPLACVAPLRPLYTTTAQAS